MVAEGIEDGPTLERLTALGCDFGQGFFLAEPMPGEQVLAWLEERGQRQLAGGVSRAQG